MAWYGIASGLVLAAAFFDWRTRRIPILIGYGMILLAFLFLLVQNLWWSAAFLALVVYGSRSPSAMLPSVIIWIAMAQSGQSNPALVAGLYLATLLLWLGWFQGGDTQIAYALLALAGDWWIFAYLFGGTILFGLLLIIAKYGAGGAFGRFRHVAGALNHGKNDAAAIRLPWAVLAAVFAWTYFWLLPGVALQRGY